MKAFLQFMVLALLVVAILFVPTRYIQAANFDITDGDVAGLITAINVANGNSEPDTINLASNGSYTLTAVDNINDGPNGLPSTTSNITINGNGATIERSKSEGIPDFRVFHVANVGILTLNDLTVSGGIASAGFGGGIANVGDLILNNATVSGNNSSGNGGGIGSDGQGLLILINSIVSDNESSIFGGGISAFGTATLTNSTVSGNSALQGGGILNSGNLTLINTTVSGNTGNLGGGIRNSSNTIMTLTNSTVSDNTATSNGGGLYMSDLGTAILTNTTVSGNNSSGNGGGIWNGYDLTLTNATVSNNTSGGAGGGIYNSVPFNIFRLKNTIIGGNLSGGDCSGQPVNSFGHNLDSDGSCITDGVDEDFTAPTLLSQLSDNGGSTETHALLSDSPAIDAIPVDDCTDLDGNVIIIDQRGIERPQGEACDIGAFELVSAPASQIDLSLAKGVDDSTPNEGETIIYTISLTNNSTSTSTGIVVNDMLPSGVTYVSDDAGGDYDSVTGEWIIGTLATSTSVTLNIQASVDANTGGTTITNEAEIIASDRADPNLNNNSDTAVITVVGPVLNPANGHRYELVSESVNWSDAKTAAETRVFNGIQGHLATIVSQQENDFIISSFPQIGGPWVGGFQPPGSTEPDGGWEWVTGEPFSYTNWDLGEPNNAGGGEDAIVFFNLNSQGLWNDIPGTRGQAGYIVEYDTSIASQVDLSIAKVVNNTTPSEGDTIIYTISLTNNSTTTSTGILVNDNLPSGVTYVSDDAGGNYDPISGDWIIGTLATSTSTILNIQAKVDTGTVGTTITNTSDITTSDQVDPDLTNNSDSADISVKTPVTCTPVPSGIISWWAGDGNTDDIVGGNDGQLQNGATFAPGMVDDALSFDGIDDYMEITDQTGFDFGSGSFSVSAWISTVATTSGGNGRDDILAKGDPTISGFAISMETNSAAFWVGRSGELFGSSRLNDGQWHHIVGTRNDSGSIALYVDGLLDLSGDNNENVDTSTSLFIGKHGTTNASYFDGLIDEVTIFNRALSDGEIKAIFDAGSAGKCKGPIGPFDLSIDKAVDNATPNEGDTIIYTISLTNNSTSTSTGILVKDKLPSGVTYVSDDAGGNYDPINGDWIVGTIATSTSAILNIQATVDTGTVGTTITNTAEITASDQVDPDLTNNSDSADISVKTPVVLVNGSLETGTNPVLPL